MRIRRKYNLGRVGHQYESVEIEVEGEGVWDIITRIDKAWTEYAQAIKEGKVE